MLLAGLFLMTMYTSTMYDGSCFAARVAFCAMVGNFVSDGRRFVPGLVRGYYSLAIIIKEGFVLFVYENY